MLLQLTKPMPDESLLGYLVRLASINEYKSPLWLLELDRHPIFMHTFAFYNYAAKKVLPQLEALTHYEREVLTNLCYKSAKLTDKKNIKLEFYSEQILRGYLQPNHPKMCPECLKENAYYRKIWDLLLCQRRFDFA